ncbi:unnamed protein product, partial [Mesorhabditis spiculigera]
MLRFLLLLAISAAVVSCFGENGQYQLDELNPSFILRGDEFGNDTIVINPNETGATLQINGLFTNVNNVSLSVVTPTQLFTQSQIISNGARGLRIVFFPVTIAVAKSSDRNFWLSVTLISPKSVPNDVGLDDYVLQTFTPTTKITPPYTIQSNSTTSTLRTIVNTQYSKTACFPFEMTDLKIDTGCNITMYAGAAPYKKSAILYQLIRVTDHDYNTFYGATFSYNYYTFQIPAGCTVSFRLAESKNITERDYDPGYWTQGFVASCEFPGFGLNQYAPATPVHTLIRAKGQSTIDIKAMLWSQTKVGNGGSFQASVLEGGKAVATLNQTDKNLEGHGHDLQVDYTPGAPGRTGLLLTYSFGDPDVVYYDVSSDPLIYDTRIMSTKAYQVQCTGAIVQVNANNATGAGNIIFTDATQTWSILDVAKQSRRFNGYVHVSGNDNSAYVAAFTCLNQNMDSTGMGLDNYQIYSYRQNTKSTLVIPSKSGPQAVTIAPTILSSLGVFLSRPVVSGSGCSAQLYVSGVPSKNRKSAMMLYKFNSSTTDKFVQSGLFSVFTFVLPAGCGFNVDLADSPDNNASYDDGAHGFMVSKEYPGYLYNYWGLAASSFSKTFIKNTNLDDVKFTIDMPLVDPGTGMLNLTIFNTDKNTNQIISSYSTDRHLSSVGFMMRIDWQPQFTKSGMLLKWRMDAVKAGSAPSLFAALFVVFYYLWK